MAHFASQNSWLPPGKHCAILLSVDDVHPATAAHGAEAGGDLGQGMLRHLLALRCNHPGLRFSLSVTADWRMRTPLVTRTWLPQASWLAPLLYYAPRWPAGTFRLDRHPDFVRYITSLAGVEIVPHGLHHVRRGLPMHVEFADASERTCRLALRQIDRIMRNAGITSANGFISPGWAAPAPLRRAVRAAGLAFIASARDIITPVAADARTAMSGLVGQPLIHPGLTEEGLVHIPVNFQATSEIERALRILDHGGLLSIKAHAIKSIGRYVALDGLDEAYAAYLDTVLSACQARFGDAIWWASMGDIADRAAPPAASAMTARHA